MRSPNHPLIAGRITAVLICLLAAALPLSGCSKEKKALADIQQAYDRKEYREAVALCKHAIRQKIDSAEVYYYYGISLVSLNRDYEGFRQLDQAVKRDPGTAVKTSNFLYREAVRSSKENSQASAERRMQKAKEVNPALDLGVYKFMVADSYYSRKEYSKSAQMYGEALEAYPDSSAAEQAYFKMADSYAELGIHSRARESFEKLLELYPRGQYKTEARWRLVNLLYDEGEKNYLLGNYEETVGLINKLIDMTANPGLIQKSRFLLGETYEALGEFDMAYKQYREVIKGDRGASGSIVEKAREKIEAFKEAGLY